jgi:hypothetical protein
LIALPTAGAADADFPADLGRVRQQQGAAPSFQEQPAHFRFSPDSGHITASHRSATKSADARRGAAHGGELGQMPELLRKPRNGRRHKFAMQKKSLDAFWIL